MMAEVNLIILTQLFDFCGKREKILVSVVGAHIKLGSAGPYSVFCALKGFELGSLYIHFQEGDPFLYNVVHAVKFHGDAGVCLVGVSALFLLKIQRFPFIPGAEIVKLKVFHTLGFCRELAEVFAVGLKGDYPSVAAAGEAEKFSYRVAVIGPEVYYRLILSKMYYIPVKELLFIFAPEKVFYIAADLEIKNAYKIAFRPFICEKTVGSVKKLLVFPYIIKGEKSLSRNWHGRGVKLVFLTHSPDLIKGFSVVYGKGHKNNEFLIFLLHFGKGKHPFAVKAMPPYKAVRGKNIAEGKTETPEYLDYHIGAVAHAVKNYGLFCAFEIIPQGSGCDFFCHSFHLCNKIQPILSQTAFFIKFVPAK